MITANVYELASPYQLVLNEKVLADDQLAEDELVGQTIYSAISPGTEIAAWQGLPPLRPSTVYPRLVGYCNLARVIKIGNAISEIKIGDFILTHQSHRSAFICKEKEVLLHFSQGEDALFRKITTSYLYHLGYSSLLKGGYQPGYHVAVVGMGTLGITTAELIKTYGIQPLIFTNQSNSEFLTERCGFSNVFKKQCISMDVMKNLCSMDGVDIVINTSNKWEDHLLSMQLVRKGGEIVCLGFPGRGETLPEFNPLDSQYFYDKQLSIKHCGHVTDADLSPIDKRFTLKRNMNYLASLIMQKKLNPEHILSMTVPWDNLDLIYKAISTHKEPIYSAIIDWRSLCV